MWRRRAPRSRRTSPGRCSFRSNRPRPACTASPATTWRRACARSASSAAPIHSCLICQELEIPFQIVPRESSVLCAMGMLLSDLKHDFVRTFVSNLDRVDWDRLDALIGEMTAEGERQLDEERIAPARRRRHVKLDCRYVKQYHEVSFDVPRELIAA